MSNHHQLKIWPEFFRLVMADSLHSQIRKNDRDYQLGDTVQFFEWTDGKGFTGRRSPYYRVAYVLTDIDGLKDGYAMICFDGPWGGNPPESMPC